MMKALLFKWFTVMIIICFIQSAEAQLPLIRGKIMDEATHKGIANVNLSLIGSTRGGITDHDGFFSIVTDTIPIYLTASHLGYETQMLWIDHAIDGITILLKPSVKMLDEIEIMSEKGPESFFEDKHYAVLDYEVENTLIYLLIYRCRLSRAELICKSVGGDTIAKTAILSFKPTCLFYDCLGKLHVLSADSAYQVYVRKDTMIFLHKADIRKFQKTLIDCVAANEDWLVFREESPDHMTVNFYRIHRKSKLKFHLASTHDKEKLQMLRNNPRDYYLLLCDTIPDSYGAMIEWIWVRKILYKPNASVVKKISDTLVLFDVTEGKASLYDINGSFISEISFPLLGKGREKWTKEIYVDEMTHKLYTTCIQDGRFVLYRYDLDAGELKQVCRSAFTFPQKIRVNLNFLYYLYDSPGEWDNKKLYRQKIDT
jgi:hypothetical protein